MSLPPGPFPGDYSVNQGSPKENWTGTGSEVSVEYVGPSNSRVGFLEQMFGSWRLQDDKLCPDKALSERVCAAELLAEPKAYPYPTILEGANCSGDACLWPDSFASTPAQSGGYPTLYDCPDSDDPWDAPIENDCPTSITINYRHKAMGKMPDIFGACYRSPVGIPIVPYGTYVEVRSRYDDVVIEHPGRAWQYKTEGVFPDGDFLGTPEEISQKKKNLQLPADIGVFETINSQRVELIWDYVPNPPWHILNAANGSVNAFPFLGYPAESVRFTMGEPEIRGGFGCTDFYRLRMNFDVRTTLTDCELPAGIGFGSGEYVALKGFMVGGAIGIWNRRFSELPMSITYGSGCKTHWVPVSDGDGNPPFQTFPFEWLFAMNLHCHDQMGADVVKYYDPSTQSLAERACDTDLDVLDRYGENRVTWVNSLGTTMRSYFPMVAIPTADILNNYMTSSVAYNQHSGFVSANFTPYTSSYCA